MRALVDINHLLPHRAGDYYCGRPPRRAVQIEIFLSLISKCRKVPSFPSVVVGNLDVNQRLDPRQKPSGMTTFLSAAF